MSAISCVLQLLYSQFNCTMVDVIDQQLKDRGTDILQLYRAVVRLFEVRGEH